MLLREIADREPHPTAAIFDSRMLQSSPESGERAAYDGAKRRRTVARNLGWLAFPGLCNGDAQALYRFYGRKCITGSSGSSG